MNSRPWRVKRSSYVNYCDWALVHHIKLGLPHLQWNLKTPLSRLISWYCLNTVPLIQDHHYITRVAVECRVTLEQDTTTAQVSKLKLPHISEEIPSLRSSKLHVPHKTVYGHADSHPPSDQKLLTIIDVPRTCSTPNFSHECLSCCWCAGPISSSDLST